MSNKELSLNKIHKLTLPIKPRRYEVFVPQSAVFLSAAAVNDSIQVWFSFDDDDDRHKATHLICAYTGLCYLHRDQLRFLGTCVIASGSLIVHVFHDPTADCPLPYPQ